MEKVSITFAFLIGFALGAVAGNYFKVVKPEIVYVNKYPLGYAPGLWIPNPCSISQSSLTMDQCNGTR